jgi:hypothetical protein
MHYWNPSAETWQRDPSMGKPHRLLKVKGVPLSEPPSHRRFEKLVAQARASYKEWRKQVRQRRSS